MKKFKEFINESLNTKDAMNLYGKLDSIKIIFDFIKQKDSLFYYNDYNVFKKMLYQYDKEYKDFYIYKYLWSRLDADSADYDLKSITDMIERYFKIKDFRFRYENDDFANMIEKHFVF